MAKDLQGQVTSFQEAEEAARPSSSRPIHWFDFPKSVVDLSGVVKVGLVENKASEELMATNRAAGDSVRLGLELARQALRFVNDTPVNTGDDSLDRFWNSENAGYSKVRQLILAAYMTIHNATDDEAKSFLASRRTSY